MAPQYRHTGENVFFFLRALQHSELVPAPRVRTELSNPMYRVRHRVSERARQLRGHVADTAGASLVWRDTRLRTSRPRQMSHVAPAVESGQQQPGGGRGRIVLGLSQRVGVTRSAHRRVRTQRHLTQSVTI